MESDLLRLWGETRGYALRKKRSRALIACEWGQPVVVGDGVKWLAPDQMPTPGPPQLVFFP